jgi:hypothetical protein
VKGAALWAITCYFNPSGYKRKLFNYRHFRRHLPVPLACVELSFGGPFDLGPSDADLLVQIRGEAILWQKERLLNVALQHLPGACSAVAWVDCDVIFERSDWPERAEEALSNYPFIHLFQRRCYLASTAASTSLDLRQVESEAVSLGYLIETGQASPDHVRRSGAPLILGSTAGLAWAARREVVSRRGLYDACILGTGDRVMAAAAVGRFDYGIDALLMNPRQAQHYLSWARPFFAAVRARVGHVEGRVYHLWHGDLLHRRYHERHEGLRRYNFDPFVDIARDMDECWRWNSNKYALHAYVRGYFESRNEDGTDLPVVPVGHVEA